VRAAVGAEDEAGAVAALTALAASFPEAEELGGLAALVAGAFPTADLSGIGLRTAGGAGVASATPSAPTVQGLLLDVGAVRPNPTTGGASIPLTLNEEAVVEATLYDALGRRVAVLADGRYEAGHHAAVLDGYGLASGVYVVRAAMAPVSDPARGENGGLVRAFTRRITLVR
jgi:hypothetical protein